MSFAVETAHRFGFAAKPGREFWLVPLLVSTILTGLTAFLTWVGILQAGYFSPYVAAIAAIAAKICVRAGLIAAVASICMWNFFVIPPVLAFTLPSAPEITAWIAAFAAALLAAPRVPKEVSSRAPGEASGGLPFVRKKRPPNGIDHTHRSASCWDVQRSGDWNEDDHYGGELGRMWVDARQCQAPGTPPLAFILGDMVQAREFSGVEAGFANAIERAVANSDQLPLGLMDSARDHDPYHLRS